MKKQLLNVFAIAAFLLASLNILKAEEVIFETNFNAAEGWVTEGTTASSPLTTVNQTITYNGKQFAFTAVRCAVTPAGKALGTCSAGYIDLGKNDNSDMSKNGIGTKTTAGYFLLPVFDQDVQISFFRASASNPVNRVMAIEYSLDGGGSWMADDETIAPQFGHPVSSEVCGEFICPKRFPAGTPIRITVHSNSGALKLISLKVTKFVADNIPPALESSAPFDGETGISPSLREVKLTFSEPVKSGGDAGITVMNKAATSKFELTSDMLKFDQNTVTIPFPVDFHLNLNDEYYAIADRGSIKDMANNPTTDDVLITFFTKATGNSEKEILSFKIHNQIGTEVINSQNATINVTANYDVDLMSDLKPAITLSEYATADLVSYKDFSTGTATYIVTAEDGSKKTWTVTITKQGLKQANLPVVYKGDADHSWKYITAEGWIKNLTSDDNTVKMNNISFTTANINNTSYWVENYFKPGANRISFRIRYGNNTSNFKIALKESADGDLWEDVVVYTPSGAPDVIPTTDAPDLTPMIPVASSTIGLRSYPLKPTSQYVKWFYEVRSSTSYYIDDVIIENTPVDNVAPSVLTTQEVTYTNYNTNSKAQIFIPFSETVKVGEDLIKHNVAIKLKGLEDVNLYEDHILTLRDGNLVLTNLDALLDQFEYTVEIPAGALVDLSNNPYAGGSIKFTTNFPGPEGILSVKKQSIVLSVEGGVLNISEPVAKVAIYNQLGVLVKTAGTKEIPVTGLKGVHIVKCTMPDGSTKIAKTIF